MRRPTLTLTGTGLDKAALLPNWYAGLSDRALRPTLGMGTAGFGPAVHL